MNDERSLMQAERNCEPTSMGTTQSALACIPVERVQQLIFLVRGEKVMLDSHLAELYGVETGALNRAVRRNAARFPDDFMFQLTAEEMDNLRCQIGISSSRHGGRRRSRPYAFTVWDRAIVHGPERKRPRFAGNVR
jgi:hypothetical protein